MAEFKKTNSLEKKKKTEKYSQWLSLSGGIMDDFHFLIFVFF